MSQTEIHHTTAILLFTRDISEESNVKHFTPVSTANQLIAGKLISHTQSIIRKSGLSWFVIDSVHQHGNNFAERFTDAIQQIFNKGFKQLIVIGNDCPELTTSDLLEASQRLEEDDFVLGPAIDGGVYLFGIRRSIFDPRAFMSAPWNSKTLFQYFIGYFKKNSFSCFVSTRKNDLDTTSDLNFQISTNSGNLIISYIKSVISSFNKVLHYSNQFILRISDVCEIGLRAPPAA